MPYFALIIMYYHVKIACYHGPDEKTCRHMVAYGHAKWQRIGVHVYTRVCVRVCARLDAHVCARMTRETKLPF